MMAESSTTTPPRYDIYKTQAEVSLKQKKTHI